MVDDMNDKKLQEYLDKNFEKLIKRDGGLSPKEFFSEKWEDCEEIPIYSRYAHISFLDRFSQKEKDLYLLKYSLKHLTALTNYFCKNGDGEEIESAFIMLTISDWDSYPEDPLCFSFFITYKYRTLFEPAKPFVKSHTKQSFYVIELLKELNIADNYFVCDNSSPIDPELQRVYVGLKKHPDPNLITLDHFVGNSS